MLKLSGAHNKSSLKRLFLQILGAKRLKLIFEYAILNQIPKIYICTLFLGTPLAFAQEIVCVPPPVPELPSDLDTQIEYKQELAQEYNDYFRFAAEYLNCLNASGASTRVEIDRAISQFNALLNLPDRYHPNVADDADSYLLQ